MVGQKTFDTDPNGKDIPKPMCEAIRNGIFAITRFEKWQDCVDYLHQRKIRLVGVEIDEKSKSVSEVLDHHDTAFLMGNEGDGIHPKLLKSCGALVKLSQYGVGTASLNVYVAASIVMYKFHMWQRQCSSDRG